MKKLLCVMAMLCMSLCLFANGAGETADGPETVTITMAYQGVQDGADFDNLYITKLIEKKFNVELKFNVFPMNALGEKMNIAFAAGELGDIVIGQNAVPFIKQQGLDANMFVQLDDYFENGKGFGQRPEWPELKKCITEADGHIYTFPRGNKELDGIAGIRMFWNKKAIADLGFDIPKTLDELYEIMVAFKETYNEYPIGGVFNMRATHAYFMNAFNMNGESWGTGFGQYLNNMDGKIVSTYAHPNYKAYLEFMNKCYNEGLIDPEYFTQSQAQNDAKILGNKYLVFAGSNPAHIFAGMPEAFNYGRTMPLTSEYNPEPWYGHRKPYSGNAAVIMATAKNPQLCFDIVDWFGTVEGNITGQGYFPASLIDPECIPEGVEMKNIETVRNEDGSLTMYEPIGGNQWKYENQFLTFRASNVPGVRGWDVDSPEGKIAGCELPVPSTTNANAQDQYEAKVILKEYMREQPRMDTSFKFLPEEEEVRKVYETELSNYMSEMHAKFIMGVESLDNYDAYLKSLEKYHYSDLLAVYQAAFDRFNEV